MIKRTSRVSLRRRRHFEKNIEKCQWELRKSLQETQDKISDLSHEMLTPTVIAGLQIKSILEGKTGFVDESVRTVLKSTRQHLKYAECVASQTLTAEKLRCMKLPQKELYDIRLHIIDFALAMYEEQLEKRNIGLDSSMGSIPPNTLFVKPHNYSSVMKVIMNFIINSIKYAGKGCSIAFGYRLESRGCVLTAYNSGKPIPKKIEDTIFEKFVRGKKDGSGSGFGLYSSRKRVENMGGKMWLEADNEGHPIFMILLPINKAGIIG
ncbi:MAG: PAS/PAC sensor signal transduction histidine kinase [Candidatus Moranbacteria bacterium GW2011_GWE1_49_15]|nr:MAG: PAS/PAC sensor signal transduction histidine kinase [Candidatus Moranbacteria bacterium GW2011_GWE1_49_15]HBP01447.1 hypothetical protein [Candidatus Moranbacteria bacterium]